MAKYYFRPYCFVPDGRLSSSLNFMAKYYFRSYYLTSGEDEIHFFSSPEEREYFIHQRYDDYTPIKYHPSIAEWDKDDIVELNGIVVGFSGEIE